MDPRVQKVLILMGHSLHKKQSLKWMAQSVNLSLWHLHRLFKSETGMTPAKYVKHLGMQTALNFLENTFLSVKEIMLKVGIHDESHFVRDFKLAYGMTPIRYRALFLAENLTKNETTAKLANK